MTHPVFDFKPEASHAHRKRLSTKRPGYSVVAFYDGSPFLVCVTTSVHCALAAAKALHAADLEILGDSRVEVWWRLGTPRFRKEVWQCNAHTSANRTPFAIQP